MSGSLSQEQQAELQVLQQMSQQLNSLHQSYLQMESKKRELEKTLESIKEMSDDNEIYRSIGNVLFKAGVAPTRTELTDELELLDTRVNRSKKQIEELDKRKSVINQTVDLSPIEEKISNLEVELIDRIKLL